MHLSHHLLIIYSYEWLRLIYKGNFKLEQFTGPLHPTNLYIKINTYL
jgi:hypothetical protein